MSREQELEAMLQRILKAWDSIPEETPVPEEINDSEMWVEARQLLVAGLPDIFEDIE